MRERVDFVRKPAPQSAQRAADCSFILGKGVGRIETLFENKIATVVLECEPDQRAAMHSDEFVHRA